jgi:D-alanine-D-alanine ligase
MRRLRVGILFGGRSGEHEVSLASASSLLDALDPSRYEAVPIGIGRDGSWQIGHTPQQLMEAGATRALPSSEEALVDPSHHGIMKMDGAGPMVLHDSAIDVVFPVLHGPNGEDGTVQGLLVTAGIPYVGSEVLGSALAMDKWRMKAVFAQWGLPNVPHVGFRAYDWAHARDELLDRLENELDYPVFVKPSNMGSSVGISKARTTEELEHGIDVATRYDSTVIVEQGIDGREIELGVLGNEEPLVSVPGEIRPSHDFYDYQSKYTEGLAELIIPASLEDTQIKRLSELARKAFLAVDAAGLARVDFFIRSSDGEILLNEVNTMPGFTATSMYPKLWEATGVPYPELIDRLIRLALQRFDDRQRRRVTL